MSAAGTGLERISITVSKHTIPFWGRSVSLREKGPSSRLSADGPTARRLITEETPPNAGDASGVLEVVVDDRITTGWYLTCDPGEHPTLVTAHLAA